MGVYCRIILKWISDQYTVELCTSLSWVDERLSTVVCEHPAESSVAKQKFLNQLNNRLSKILPAR
jgi:hypothetical protein